MVNHLWIEDTYARWKVMALTDSKYTHLPRHTNLQVVVGRRRIDHVALAPVHSLSDSFGRHQADFPKPAVAAAASRAGGPSAAGGDGATNSMVSRLAVTILGTPAPATRPKRDAEELPAPPGTGSRKAKEMVIARLHEQPTGSSGRSRKRLMSADSGGDDDRDNDDGHARKRARSAPNPLSSCWSRNTPTG